MRYILILIISFSFLMADRDGGPYIGVGYGSSTLHNDGLYGELKKDRSNGATFYLGAYMNKYFSVEMNYVSFDAWNHNNGYEIDDTSTMNFGVLSFSTLAHYAFFEDSLDFYAKFGVGEISLGGISATGFAFVTGGGVAYRISKRVALKIAYDLYTFDFDENGDGVDDRSMSIDYVYSAIEYQF